MNQEANQTAHSQTRVKSARTWLIVLVSALVVLALSAVGILYGQRLVDSIRASQYQPTAQMMSVRERIGLTSRATDVFYATSPVIESKETFNASCHSEERTVAILGCYYRDRIYLYDIRDTQLDGTLEVTAAHEILHAVYQRLNFFERRKVDELIAAQYARLKDDANLKEIMQYYEKAEPGAESNELHSILGTTIAALSPELEQYYAQYLTDRGKVVALNAAYNKVFGDSKRQAKELEDRIKAAEPGIAADLAAYEADRRQLESDIESFNQEVASGGYGTRGAFNAARGALVARVDAMNSRRDSINTRVAAYNADVAALNNLAIQVNHLYESINGAEATGSVQ